MYLQLSTTDKIYSSLVLLHASFIRSSEDNFSSSVLITLFHSAGKRSLFGTYKLFISFLLPFFRNGNLYNYQAYTVYRRNPFQNILPLVSSISSSSYSLSSSF
ncbi:hypothetical protein WA026_001644 [Henosepilachna vigintioctopunctata]|uniref:Uncharacterized protein n=1 Tax=Henosepilachna vigintioctopunctata TaxID=420089 RepID=A0AAW1UIM2_9CUCU